MGLKTDIANLLSSAGPSRVNFQLGGNRVQGSDYGRIAGHIRSGHIQIVQSQRMPSTRAAYNRTLNCFTVGANPSDSLIVHEATHAINDMNGRSLRGRDDEALAYVAQMIFVCQRQPAIRNAARTPQTRMRTDQALMVCGTNQSVCNTATIGYATIIAATILDGQTPAPNLLAEYRQALERDPNTIGPSRQRNYRNVGRVEIPADYLDEVQGTIITD